MKIKLGRTQLHRSGHGLVAEDTEVGFPAPEEADRQDTACARMLQLAWQEGLQIEAGRAGPISVLQSTQYFYDL
jgi:hypothetical protein